MNLIHQAGGLSKSGEIMGKSVTNIMFLIRGYSGKAIDGFGLFGFRGGGMVVFWDEINVCIYTHLLLLSSL